MSDFGRLVDLAKEHGLAGFALIVLGYVIVEMYRAWQKAQTERIIAISKHNAEVEKIRIKWDAQRQMPKGLKRENGRLTKRKSTDV